MRPVIAPYTVDGAPHGTPQVTELHYDIWTLRVTLDFDDWDGVVYADFASVCGFRVLDESDLLEMWQAEGLSRHWLYVVRNNGWLAQECVREGFTQEAGEVTEYFVRGADDCISILALDEPVITVLGDSD